MHDRKNFRNRLDSASVVVPFPGHDTDVERNSGRHSQGSGRSPGVSAIPEDTGTPATRNMVLSKRLTLALRTSLLCEFRDPFGRLQAFEVCRGQTTFGVFCQALSTMPGVEFPYHRQGDFFQRPSRFTFRGQMYEASIPDENIHVCPIGTEEGPIDMEEL